MCSPLPHFLCPDDSIVCSQPYTQNPSSVHFTVTSTGYTQFAELTDTTFGINYINGAYPGLAALLPISDVNGPWIHIAIDSDCADSLVTLLCCIATDLGISLPIISAGDLQTNRPELELNPTLQTQVDACFASGGFVNPPNIFDLQQDIIELQACCLENSSDIIAIQELDIVQNGRLLALEQRTTVLEESVQELYDIVQPLPALIEIVQQLQNQVNDILTRCCPQQTETECFHYQLLPGDEMLLTPNQPIWLNLPTKIEDREEPNCTTGCKGPIVTPGALWRANLCDCTWSLEATVRFRLASWCPGKKAEMFLIACGKKYLLASYTIPNQGLQSVTLHGTFLLPTPPCCKDVHLLIGTNDDTITTAKVVEFADFKGCCV